ncbi:hypothetical protein [Streptomyces sp. NPDC045251]|uniref:hypothetical protein n=1 Tax=unclassified Streptomyces TaxID=2593676 RepID=UPI0033EB35D5
MLLGVFVSRLPAVRRVLAGHQLAGQLDGDVSEVGLGSGPVGLRDERIDHPLAGLETNFPTAVGDVGADHLVEMPTASCSSRSRS